MTKFKSDGSLGTGPMPKGHIEEEVPGATIETEFHHTQNIVVEDHDHNPEHEDVDLPDIECDISGGEDKSQETSKIYKLMETVRENVLFKNPLNKVKYILYSLLIRLVLLCWVWYRYRWLNRTSTSRTFP